MSPARTRLDPRYDEPRKMVEAVAVSEKDAVLIEEILSHPGQSTP